MPLFKFQVSDEKGKTKELIIDGDSEENAIARIRQRGYLPMQSFGEVSSTGSHWRFRSSFNVYTFTNRLLPLLEAHVTLERALGIIAGSTTKAQEREIIVSLRQGLHEGKKFSELIRDQGTRFPRIYANLIEAGEESGCLPAVVGNLQRFLSESKEQKDFLITSSIYPAVILTITLLVLALVFGVFIPRFAQIFVDMGKELPLPTQILLTFSRIVNVLWPLWLLLALLVVWFIVRVRQGGREREWYDSKILKVPVLGRLLITIEMERFCRTLAILTGNSVHLLKSVQISLKTLQNRTVAQSFDRIVPELRGGTKLSDALAQSPFMSMDVIQMLRVGEESGAVAAMLAKVSDELEKSIKVEIKRLLALFEPVVIVLLALVILVVVVSIFLAIIEMNNI